MSVMSKASMNSWEGTNSLQIMARRHKSRFYFMSGMVARLNHLCSEQNLLTFHVFGLTEMMHCLRSVDPPSSTSPSSTGAET